MITIDDLHTAEKYTVFRGPVDKVDISPEDWDLFSVSGHSELPREMLKELRKRGIQLVGDAMYFSPQIDDERTHGREPRVDDFHAAMAYLNEGGTIVKVPDSYGSKYSRYYAVARVKGAVAGKCLPAEKCVWCGELCEGSYAIHENRNMEGIEVPLCNRCGGSPVPTCGEIWSKLEKVRLKK